MLIGLLDVASAVACSLRSGRPAALSFYVPGLADDAARAGNWWPVCSW
ncbi:hypothetical protein [Streptomyces sp. NPDC102360]